MGLAQMLEWNRGFLARRGGGPAATRTAPAAAAVALVACDEAAIEPLLGGALGIAPGEAVVLRSPAAVVLADGELIRSLVLAVYQDGVSEVLVLGHSGCRMAGFAVAPFTEAFRRRGVPRSAFGDVDLRTWLGAAAGPAQAVAQTVRRLRESALLPRDLAIAGLLLDDATGSVEVLTEAVLQAPVQAAAADVPPPPDRPGGEPDAGPAPSRPSPASSPAEAEGEEPSPVAAVSRLLAVLERNRDLRPRLERLREELARERNPVAQLTLVDAMLHQLGRQASEARDALAEARREAGRSGGTATLAALLELFRGRSRKGR